MHHYVLSIEACLLCFASTAGATPTTQERFQRSMPRVSKWVMGVLDVSRPIEATVEVLDAEQFEQRAKAAFYVPDEDVPSVLIAVTTSESEILVSEPMFNSLVERAAENGLFADDVVTLVLAHELVHVAQFDALATVTPGPNADAKRRSNKPSWSP
ncbi:MAG: hypothetical protein AB8F26_04295 [Phycisphaerales bacterium]